MELLVDFDTMLSEAAPARRELLDGPDSPAARSLYRQITMAQPATAAASRRRGVIALPFLGVAGALAAAGLVLMLISGSPVTTAREGSPARPAPAPGRPETFPEGTKLAAWTVQKTADGSVTFTVQNITHPARLQRALAKAGIRAVVRLGEICIAKGPGQPLIGDENGFMETNSPVGVGAYYSVMGGPDALSDLGWSWTVFPSKMPRDGQFVISGLAGKVPAADIQAVWEFAKTSAPISCAKYVNPDHW
jgi:hypothetical protein